MDLHHRVEVLLSLCLGYFHSRDYVDDHELDQPYRQQLPPNRRVCSYSIQRRQVAVRWLYHLLLPPRTFHIPLRSGTLFSELQMAYEARKAKKIIASRDISYAFTNVMANNYYSLSQSAPFECLPNMG